MRAGRPRRPPCIRSAYEPRGLDPTRGPHPLGSCNSWSPLGCNGYGYASGDVYFLEVCIYEIICRNGLDLYEIAVGETFHCDLYDEGLNQLKNWILYSN